MRLFSKHWQLIATLALGLLVSVAGFRLTAAWQSERTDHELDRAAVRVEEGIRAELETAERMLDSLDAFFAASSHVDRAEFAIFTTQLRDSRGVQGLGWNPVVSDEHREAFEAAAVAEGLDGFEFRERSADGVLTRAAPRDVYFPAFYLEPLEGNEAAFGFDLGSEEARRAGLDAARDSGEAAAVLVRLVQESGTQTGMLLFQPVYTATPPPPAVAARRATLEGFLVGVYRVGDLLAPVLTRAADDGLAVRLVDITADAEIPINTGGGDEVSAQVAAETAHDVGTLTVADRTWTIFVEAADAPGLVARSRLPVTVAGATMLLFVVLGGYFRSVIGRTRRIEVEVEQRTAEVVALASAGEQLGVSLSQREERLNAILDTAADAIIGISDRGLIDSFNRAAERMFGYRADEVIGQSVEVLMPSSTAHAHQASIDHYVDTGEATTVVGQVRADIAQRRDGSEFPIQLSVSEVVDATGRSFTGIVRDMTEIKEAEQRLRERAEEAQALAVRAEGAVVSKAAFLATMSHEIRTPMNGVIGMTGLLLATELNEEQLEYGRAIRSSGETLLALINDILDFSKIEAGRMELESMSFSLRDTVYEIAEILAHRSDAGSLELVVHCADDVPSMLIGDAGRLRQILLNLGSNAVKFTSDGHVLFSIEDGGVLPDGRHRIQLAVSDTGIGIPPELQETIFEEFTQADASTTRNYGGTGLGLAIVQQLVAAMDGTVQLESSPGAGSTFTVEIPLPSTTLPAYPEPQSVAEGRVLVMAARDLSRASLMEQLKIWQIEAASARSPEEAITLLNAETAGRPFSVVICDDGGEDVAEILEQIHAGAPQFPRSAIVVVVSVSQRAAAALAIAEAAIVSRPPHPSRLMDAIATAAGGPRADSAVAIAGELKDQPAQGARILVAEDNAVNRILAERMLQKLGCQVEVVANGREAVDALAAAPYDLIFMDCQMPEMDGYEATGLIRSGNHQSDIPIVAMTANAMEGDRERCLEAGMDDYVAKPVTLGAMPSVLDRWLNRDRSEVA